MNITKIEEIVKKLATDINANQVNKDEFVYQLMAAYGHRKTTIGRIKSGERNLSKVDGEVRAKRHIYFKQSQYDCVLLDIDNMKKEPSVSRDKIRFVIATDFNQFVALDTRTHDTLDIEFNELGKHFDFFLPWAGMEKAVYQGENPADVKAAEKMAKLFDLIKADNFNEENNDDTTALHNLNVFLTRLLFCFFAEDTGIFTQNQFSGELESHTKVDGSDVDSYLNRLFEVLNTSKENRGDLPDYLANFEFVNGGLFANTIASPRFATKSRKMLIECGSELDWSNINPDIFGSMIQAVVHPDQRGGMGMHYTSVTNIMKVIEPLYLDELYAEFENIEDNIDAKLKPSRLRKLHDRIAEIKIFDPACGSGNFLIIAFKELRKLEMEIIKRLQELEQNDNQDDLFNDVGLDSSFSRIKLSQFYGIELDDFAHEVAILSLWLAEHQMNVEFKSEFGECEPTLPLHHGGNIVHGNACNVDWNVVCHNDGSEIYVCGNPPYAGQRNQIDQHKVDLDVVFSGMKDYKKMDYISCWFFKASTYIKNNQMISFVTTNSICQGTQVNMLWPKLFNAGIEIYFAYAPFKWTNNAKDKAGVTCTIIGLGKPNSGRNKYIYNSMYKEFAKNINAYLVDGENLIIEKRNSPISKLPKMQGGNQPREGGFLMLDDTEKNSIVENDGRITKFIRPLMGSNEFIKSIKRWAIWITDETLSEALGIPELQKRVESVKAHRENGNSVELSFKNVPHKFVTTKTGKAHQFIIPIVSSEKREYIPMGLLSSDVVVTSKAFSIFDQPLYVLGLLLSRMHMQWVKAVSGRLGTGISYSSQICYNTFPVPDIPEGKEEVIANLVLDVLSTREMFPQNTLAELYSGESMPEELIDAHAALDSEIEKLYSASEFKSDIERLSLLFSLYKEMTGGQNA
ncbi:DNA methyltransferase [Shewanella sp. TC10]|uniref:DNA methyltransferase n=1 Tax=Shewanella sp. TC10 TaxID=1419739 RepID=UPI00129E73BD|nr:DNA methyltransferase [Shewanella sp. TC10]